MPDGEAESYRHHVTECVECAEKVAELKFVSHALLSAVPQLTAPPEIRHRVMAVVRAEAELLQAAGAGADRPAASRATPRRLGLRPAASADRGRACRGAHRPRHRGRDAAARRAVVHERARRPSSRRPAPAPAGKLTICEADARLALDGMAPLPDGRIYQLWLDDPDDGKLPKAAGAVHRAAQGPRLRRRGRPQARHGRARDGRAQRWQRGADGRSDRQGVRLTAAGRRGPAATSAPWPRRRARRRRSPATATPTARRACRARTAAVRSARTA